MENTKFLLPVLLSIMNDYKAQASKVAKELQEIEHTLTKSPSTSSLSVTNTRVALKERRLTLKCELIEKEALIEEFTALYAIRQSSCKHIHTTKKPLR